jgi:PelA/Pel-15E family pectate lyase
VKRFAQCCLVLAPVWGAAAVQWDDVLRQPPAWYAGDEARGVAAAMLAWQSPAGGWPTDTDTTVAPTPANPAGKRAPTFDDEATTRPLHHLARVITATGDATLRAAFERGFDYLLAAQYPNGGWPQYFPLRKGYYSHITFNDAAMVDVMTLLRDAAAGRAPFAFVDEARRARAAAAVARGLACTLRLQLRHEGRLTGWAAQYDPHTLAPAWARKFEPPALASAETVAIVRFLLGEPQPTPEIIAAIEGAVAWLAARRIEGLRVEDFTGADGRPDRRAVPDPTAPPRWARFYELETNRPIFAGRDQIVRYDFNAIEQERRAGYYYLGEWPATLLAKDYPCWRARHQRP